MNHPTKPRVVELFAGVGGFRIGLERSGWETVWANQWEPSTKTPACVRLLRRSGSVTTVPSARTSTRS